MKQSTVLSQDEQKRLAAHRAVDFVHSNSILGLGTGSTAAPFLERLSQLLHSNHLTNILGVPTSLKTTALATTLRIPLADLNTHQNVELSIDGADEVDPHLNLVKGRGGSLLREKMIEGASKRFIVIVDESKMVPRLGSTGVIPVEVVPFGWKFTMWKIEKLFSGVEGFSSKLRVKENGEAFVTDNMNYIVELSFENGITGDLKEISDGLLRITGVIEHGMFLGMATMVIVAMRDGSVKVIEKERA